MVRDAVPVEQDLPLRRRREARAEHRVGLALENRRDERGIVGRVVLQVRVLDQADVAAHVLNGGDDRRPLAHVPGLADDADPRVGRGQFIEDVRRSVTAAIVHAHQLHGQADRTGQHAADDRAKRTRFVIDGNQDAEKGLDRGGQNGHLCGRRLSRQRRNWSVMGTGYTSRSWPRVSSRQTWMHNTAMTTTLAVVINMTRLRVFIGFSVGRQHPRVIRRRTPQKS